MRAREGARAQSGRAGVFGEPLVVLSGTGRAEPSASAWCNARSTAGEVSQTSDIRKCAGGSFRYAS